jgi:hypothetical protein
LQLPHRFPFLCCITNLGKKRKIYDRLISIVATARLHLRGHNKGDFFSGVAGNFELLAFVPAKAFEVDMAYFAVGFLAIADRHPPFFADNFLIRDCWPQIG